MKTDNPNSPAPSSALTAQPEKMWEALNAQEDVDDHVANCDDCCDGMFPELCEAGFPLADKARLLRRDILYIEIGGKYKRRKALAGAESGVPLDKKNLDRL